MNGLSYCRNVIPRGGGGGNQRWSTPNFNANNKSGFVGFDSNTTVSTTEPILESAIEDAAGTIHITDGMASDDDGAAIATISNETETDHYADAQTSKVAYRHFIGFNAMYGDGHVKWLKYGSTTAGNWTIQAND